MSSNLIGYGMLSIGALLKKEGFSVLIFNIPHAYTLGLSEDDVFNLIKSYDPKVIGIELNWIQFGKGAIDCAKKIKKLLPNVPIIMGGVHSTIFSTEILTAYSQFIDAVFIGEAEITFLEYLDALENGKDLSEIKGIVRIDENKRLRDQGPANIFENIDDIPPYSLNIVKPKLLPPHDLAMINTCRGPCIHNCIYCIGNKETYSFSLKSRRVKLEIHSPEWIASQIRILLREVTKLSIQDYVYCRPKSVSDIAKTLQKERIDERVESFNFAALPGSLNGEIMANLSKAGIDNIDFGIESGSDKVLKTVRRPYSISVISDSIKAAVQYGILPKTYWMVGLPSENNDDIERTKDLIMNTIKLGGVPKWVTPLCLFPSLELFEKAEGYGLRLKLKKFQDFFSFSSTKRNLNSWYPSVITHETANFSVNDILKKSLEIKRFITSNGELILEHQQQNLENYLRFHPKFDENLFLQRIKSILNLLKYTFF